MEVVVTPEAMADLVHWQKVGNKSIKTKLERIFAELALNPTVGIGQPERLRHEFCGYWSRRIDKANRVVYFIDEDNSKVFIISARGHYGDK